MSKHQHVFDYDTEAELITQCDQLLTKLMSGSTQMEDYESVRSRYSHLNPSAFSMRLLRFKKWFPRRVEARKTTYLFVTRELHEYLRHGAK